MLWYVKVLLFIDTMINLNFVSKLFEIHLRSSIESVGGRILITCKKLTIAIGTGWIGLLIT